MLAVRHGELLAALSLAIDLGLGVPMDTMLRAALVAARLGALAGLGEVEQATAYYLALLRYVGCTTTSHDDAALFGGDELAVGELIAADDDEMAAAVERTVGARGSPEGRRQAVGHFFAAAMDGTFATNHTMHCEAASILADRMGMGDAVRAAMTQIYARWDGRGSNTRAAGEEIARPMRVVHLASIVGYLGRDQPPGQLATAVGRRSGRQLDPTLAVLFADNAGDIMNGLGGSDLLALALAAEPPGSGLDDAGLDRALEAVADFADVKTPHMLGHSRRVSALAASAASRASLPASDVTLVRRAGLVHDLGRVGVPEQLWVKTGTLTPSERERVRLHSYLTERVFANLPALGEVGRIGGGHHERLDGSGYHRSTLGTAQPAAMRLLAAANAWCALTEPRPHRDTLSVEAATHELARQAREGRLDQRAVDAVLSAAGAAPLRRRAGGIALSEREIEVLRLLARQHSTKHVARTLGISPKTVERHVTHIYDKTGVTTRAGAALYATDAGLI